jgi:hypothetical protein
LDQISLYDFSRKELGYYGVDIYSSWNEQRIPKSKVYTTETDLSFFSRLVPFSDTGQFSHFTIEQLNLGEILLDPLYEDKHYILIADRWELRARLFRTEKYYFVFKIGPGIHRLYVSEFGLGQPVD